MARDPQVTVALRLEETAEIRLQFGQWRRTLERVSRATGHELNYLINSDEHWRRRGVSRVFKDSPVFDNVCDSPLHALAALHHTGSDLEMRIAALRFVLQGARGSRVKDLPFSSVCDFRAAGFACMRHRWHTVAEVV